jgi:uncharacterized protein
MLNTQQEAIIQKTKEFVQKTLEKAESGHDYWHIQRVLKASITIAQNEGADMYIVQMGALLHDIADSKFHNGDETVGPKVAKDFLLQENVDEQTIDHIVKIIENISFKNTFSGQKFTSKELEIIQDADRLDAIGAIGIARAFIYGGHKNNLMYDPDFVIDENMTKEQYKKGSTATINHFYEKLLKLKDLMNTKTGNKLAEDRHNFMLQFLDQFYKEWEV